MYLFPISDAVNPVGTKCLISERNGHGSVVKLPSARGSLSEHVIGTLGRSPSSSNRLHSSLPDDEEDGQLSLWVLQQLSYRPILQVDPVWEEHPSFLVLRQELEQTLEARLRSVVEFPAVPPEEIPKALVALLKRGAGPSLSGWMEAFGTIEHLREFVVHRAAYQLQEADPHSFAIPRLAAGIAKTTLLELQLDEYGGQHPDEAHSVLFAESMKALGLDPDSGAEINRLPAVTLRTNTLLNWLGRSRRLLGACLGHLAVFEMTSVEPMARYAALTRRVLSPPHGSRAARFYDVHVAADGLHARLVIDRLVRGFTQQYPEQAGDILFGAAALLHVESAFSEHVLESWKAGRSSLRATPGDQGFSYRPPLALIS